MSQIDVDKLINMVAELNTRVIELTQRVEKLEVNISTDGIYLDGAPDYVKMYVDK